MLLLVLPQIEYLNDNGCRWNADTSSYAAENGRLDVLNNQIVTPL